MVDENQSASSVAEDQQVHGEGVLHALFNLFCWLVIGCVFLWNWDGFWQTNIHFLNDAQKSLFSAKYNEEQRKIEVITRNSQLIEDINNSTESKIALYKQRFEVANEERDYAVANLREAEVALSKYVDEDKTKCRYYDTSLRMIDILARTYTEDELSRLLSCTNSECEQILFNRAKAADVCHS